MLSNPSTDLQRQQRHRRQQSTPSIYDTVKVSSLQKIQKHASHRRGMSLDPRQQPSSPQDPVSITNHGLHENPQHILREAQQQRLARPGSGYQPQYNYDNDEKFLISPLVSPQRQSFDARYSNGGEQRSPAYLQVFGQINPSIPVNSNYYSNNLDGDQDVTTFPDNDTILTPSAFLEGFVFDGSSQDRTSMGSRPSSSRRVSGGIMDRVSKFENMAAQEPQRPLTPPSQYASSECFPKVNQEPSELTEVGYFPSTSATASFTRDSQPEPSSRFLDSSMEETIKPVRSKSNQRGRTVFEEMRAQSEKAKFPSPPSTAPIPSKSTFDSVQMPMPSGHYLNMSNMDFDFTRDEGHNSSAYSPTSSTFSQAMSQPPSPELSRAQLYDAMDSRSSFGPRPSISASSSMDLSEVSSSTRGSPPPRSNSVCSINPEEAITDTGITIDDIAHYIQGPDPADGKWQCLYPECAKRFGRKENIKSHVQTHLGDRQYQCPHCKKCFVRQHDLKRHAKIHSGIKPYPCLCGNSFARHDALTRHRQRGMCIGAFEGVVKKVVKRGRPRKQRPDDEERKTKSNRTRSKIKSSSSVCSASDYSQSSYGSPPRDYDVLDDKPFGNLENYSAMDAKFFAPPPHLPCVSPQIIQAHSPNAFSQQSYLSNRSSIASMPEHQLPSPTKTLANQFTPQTADYSTPPDLCLNSSPMPQNKYYDLDASADGNLTIRNLKDLQNMIGSVPVGVDADMFMDTFNMDAAADTGMLMPSKFDEAFGGEMFAPNEEDDVFFGSP
jgi:regulatory protein SWI5